MYRVVLFIVRKFYIDVGYVSIAHSMGFTMLLTLPSLTENWHVLPNLGTLYMYFILSCCSTLPTVDVPRLPQPAGSGGLPGGTLAGIAITALLVGVLVVALVGFVMYLVIARKKMTKTAMLPDQ